MIVENFILMNSSGLKLECKIERDETRDKQPLVFIAGGFGSEAFSSSTQQAATDVFIKKGLAVMRINFQGNGNSGGDLAHATITAGLDDLSAALNHINTLSWVEYVGLCGNSYGGGLVFHEVAERKTFDYKFLILLSPRIDTTMRYQVDDSIDIEQWQKDGFIKTGNNAINRTLDWEQYTDSQKYTPWKVIRNIKIPTLIVHGDKDNLISHGLSIQVHELIKSSDLKILDGVKHQYEDNIGKVSDAIYEWLNEKI